MRILLHVIGGPGLGGSAPGGPGRPISVGRGVLAHLRVRDDDALAPIHFEIECAESGCRLRDVSGPLGVKVNGQPTRATELKVGDVIVAGQSTFEVREPGAPAQPQQVQIPRPAVASPLVVASADAARPVLDVLRGQGETLYAILDAARDPQVYIALLNCKEKHQSLYEGQKGEELSFVAPYLIHLPPGSPFLESLLKSSWGNSWGVFLTSREQFDAVRKHLRHFLMVRLVGGKQVYFRFYDPRVLRAFLPSCIDQEWTTFFGPISAYLMEGEAPTVLLRMSARAAPAKTTTIAVVPPG